MLLENNTKVKFLRVKKTPFKFIQQHYRPTACPMKRKMPVTRKRKAALNEANKKIAKVEAEAVKEETNEKKEELTETVSSSSCDDKTNFHEVLNRALIREKLRSSIEEDIDLDSILYDPEYDIFPDNISEPIQNGHNGNGFPENHNDDRLSLLAESDLVFLQNGHRENQIENGVQSQDEVQNLRGRIQMMQINFLTEKQELQSKIDEMTEKNQKLLTEIQSLQETELRREPLIKTYKDLSEMYKSRQDYLIEALLDLTGIKFILDGKNRNVTDSDIAQKIYPKPSKNLPTECDETSSSKEVKNLKHMNKVLKIRQEFLIGALYEHTGVKCVFEGKKRNISDHDIQKKIYPKCVKATLNESTSNDSFAEKIQEDDANLEEKSINGKIESDSLLLQTPPLSSEDEKFQPLEKLIQSNGFSNYSLAKNKIMKHLSLDPVNLSSEDDVQQHISDKSSLFEPSCNANEQMNKSNASFETPVFEGKIHNHIAQTNIHPIEPFNNPIENENLISMGINLIDNSSLEIKSQVHDVKNINHVESLNCSTESMKIGELNIQTSSLHNLLPEEERLEPSNLPANISELLKRIHPNETSASSVENTKNCKQITTTNTFDDQLPDDENEGSKNVQQNDEALDRPMDTSQIKQFNMSKTIGLFKNLSCEENSMLNFFVKNFSLKLDCLSPIHPFPLTKKKKSKKKKKPTPSKKLKQISPKVFNPFKNKIEQTLEDLEGLKFDVKAFVNYKHCLVNALLNPSNALSSSIAVDYIVKYLSTSQRMPLNSYVKENEESTLFPAIEDCIVKAIFEVQRKEKVHLKNILTDFRNALMDKILYDVNLTIHALTSFCRVYATSYKLEHGLSLEGQLKSAWYMCIDIVIFRSTVTDIYPFYPFAAISILSMWPNEFKLKDINDYDPMQKILLKLLLQKPEKSKIPNQTWNVCFKAIKTLIKAAGDNSVGIFSIVQDILNFIKTCDNEEIEYYCSALKCVVFLKLTEHEKFFIASKVSFATEDPELLPVKKAVLKDVFDTYFEAFLPKEEIE